MKLTPLYPPDVKPVREGVYQVYVEYGGSRQWFSRWWRGQWRVLRPSPRSACRVMTVSSICYESFFLGWRGLAEKPGEAG